MRDETKTAIVAGASGGIGLATCERLASEGARIVMADGASFVTGASLCVDGGRLAKL